MIVVVTYGVVREGMTSRSGITQRFYGISCLHPVAVADRLAVPPRRQHRGRLRRLDAVDDPAQVVVADDLAVLAEGDDRAVDEVQLVGRQREAQRVAAALHGVAARVAARAGGRARGAADR